MVGRDARRRAVLRGLGFLTALLGFGVSGCATPAPHPAPIAAPVETGQLLLWEATGPAGDRVHLLGTLHVGRTHTDFDPAIRAALGQSDVLALELRMEDLEPSTIRAAFAKVGLLSDQTIFEVVEPSTGALLRRWLAATETPEIAVASLEHDEFPYGFWCFFSLYSHQSTPPILRNDATRRNPRYDQNVPQGRKFMH